MKELNTFNKATKFKKEFYDRTSSTIEFMAWDINTETAVLDIAEPNKAGEVIANFFDHSLSNTSGNLDTDEWTCPKRRYEYVYCFEVLEHLLNPLLFLEQLRNHAPKAKVFITVPYHILRQHWGMNHFHEMDLMRLHYLFKLAGMKINRFHQKNFYEKPSVSEPMAVITGKKPMDKSLWEYAKKIKYTVRPLLNYATGYFWVKKTVRYYFECEYL